VSEWFFTSDLHGQLALYEQIVALTAARLPAALLLGGDLAPHASGEEGIARQRVFLEGFLIEFARRVRDASPATRLLLLMGNDDWAANADVLEREDEGLWTLLHERIVRVGPVSVAGCSWVPITPFAMKDWERWDDGSEETPARLEGWVSRGGGLRPFRFDPASRAPTITDALDTLALAGPARETIFVLHSPPRDTSCDMIGSRAHVGSRAIRNFLLRHAPPLTLSGHIHESPRISGSWRDRVGSTIVVNPGQFGTSRLCGVWFDPARIEATLRHTVYASPQSTTP
jgi:Icc-related predicted phosphoesterase